MVSVRIPMAIVAMYLLTLEPRSVDGLLWWVIMTVHYASYRQHMVLAIAAVTLSAFGSDAPVTTVFAAAIVGGYSIVP